MLHLLADDSILSLDSALEVLAASASLWPGWGPHHLSSCSAASPALRAHHLWMVRATGLKRLFAVALDVMWMPFARLHPETSVT